jgi:hypothetical protein
MVKFGVGGCEPSDPVVRLFIDYSVSDFESCFRLTVTTAGTMKSVGLTYFCQLESCELF